MLHKDGVIGIIYIVIIYTTSAVDIRDKSYIGVYWRLVRHYYSVVPCLI